MIDLDKLLENIQKTNPTITKEKMIEELLISNYSTNCLYLIFKNSQK